MNVKKYELTGSVWAENGLISVSVSNETRYVYSLKKGLIYV